MKIENMLIWFGLLSILILMIADVAATDTKTIKLLINNTEYSCRT